MDTTAADPQRFLLQRIRDDLGRIEQKARRLRALHNRLVFTSLLTSTAATLLAGLTAAEGPLLGAGPPAWRWSCGIIAVVTAISGVLTGLHQRFNVAERLAGTLACSGRLRALEIALGIARRPPLEVAHDYEELVAQYPDLAT